MKQKSGQIRSSSSTFYCKPYGRLQEKAEDGGCYWTAFFCLWLLFVLNGWLDEWLLKLVFRFLGFSISVCWRWNWKAQGTKGLFWCFRLFMKLFLLQDWTSEERGEFRVPFWAIPCQTIWRLQGKAEDGWCYLAAFFCLWLLFVLNGWLDDWLLKLSLVRSGFFIPAFWTLEWKSPRNEGFVLILPIVHEIECFVC